MLKFNYVPGTIILLFFAVFFCREVQAGARLDINESAYLDLGLRMQVLGIHSEKDQDGDHRFESYDDFKVRRARVRLKGVVSEMVSAFLQSDLGDFQGGAGQDARIIDAYILLQKNDLMQLYAGMHMAPGNRQNVTSSGALLALDRPGVTYKSLTWGTRALNTFSNVTYSDSDAGLRADNAVRDVGITWFGTHDVQDNVHLKFYLGAYEGIQLTPADNFRYTGRCQINFMDAEPGYYNSAMYLGKKQTVGLGFSFDSQDSVAASFDQGIVDYQYYSIDAFVEIPLGAGSFTAEAAYGSLDLDGSRFFDHDGNPVTLPRNATQAEGDGYYFQTGFFINNFQPWLEFEHFDADAETGKGSYDLYRAGMTYFLSGIHANIKGGFEQFKADALIGNSLEDKINSVVLGLFMTY